PVYHVTLNWQEGENPTDEQAFEAARQAMKAVGMEDHQYVAAVHRDTANEHVHLMVNRVHPDTYKAIYPDRDYSKLDKCMREIELEQGWRHSPGPYAVHERGGKKVVDWAKETPQEWHKEQREKKVKQPTKAKDMERHTGNESLHT
ncbi:relaxase/mobilization nuclease domain-containing protein, partial [Pseudomonas sp. 74_A]|uniref:relaxase/mobilization nuclease domain-containing protein n=1 Tax=Pseudomonas sp. 74_A TaxID=2813565 RepID=UPI001A9D8443